MHRSKQFALLFAALSLGSSRAQTFAPSESRQALASWLSQQLHRPIDASQVLSAPADASFEGCAITSIHAMATGTSLHLRCAASPLPQLVMLNLILKNSDAPIVKQRRAHSAPPTVRVGAALQADWSTPSMHAQLPVVAIESGIAGDEIRVRVKDTNRIMHARILSAHSVSILSSGV